MGTRFTSLMKQLKKVDKTYETTVVLTLDIRKQRAVTPEKWKISEMCPTIFPNHCLEKVPGLQCREGKPRSLHELKR